MNKQKKYFIILIVFSVLFNNNYVGAADVVTERMSITRSGTSILNGNFVKTNLTWRHGKKKITSSSAEQTEGGPVASALGATKDANSTKETHIYNCKSKVQIGIEVEVGPIHIKPLVKRTFLDVVELYYTGKYKVIWD